ncbi:MAG TPA: non-homologous end-joining DNA ligase [Symbiobacteriaceae bacterium]|nr:non-homologous end-joining DNA ligase [Symbiobacteriaceae bacterium]
MATVKTPVSVAGRTLTISNPTKLLWPDDGITKAELIEYYTQMAPYLLPYLRGRPLVLTRYPDGIRGKSFYHKDAPNGTPDWMPTWPFRAEDDRILQFLVAEEPAALTFVANLGAIELHPWLSRCATPDNPDWAVIDLDPSEGCTFAEVVTLARLVRQILAAVRIEGFPKLSGATGIHIYCPCGPGYTYAETATFCEAIGRVLLKVYPQKVTLERMVARRTGKIYVDYLQNRRGQTITSVYGVRPMPGAPVSAPVTWAEIEAGPPRFTIRTLPARISQAGDLFAPILTMAQDLRRATGELVAML